MESQNYRSLLREELLVRNRRNSAYSGRALAKSLGLSPGFLSQVLSGRRQLSEDRAQDLATALKWPRKKVEFFIQSVRVEGCKNPKLKSTLMTELQRLERVLAKPTKLKYEKVKHDAFRVIAEWHHLAIYELVSLSAFVPEATWIARRLNIPVEKADLAIHRLIHVGLLKFDAGKLKKTQDHSMMSGTSSDALASFHKKHLELAAIAQEKQHRDRRDFSGTTIALNQKQLARGKVLIRKLHRDLAELFSEDEPSAVYHFASQLYQLDTSGEETT